MSYELWNEAIGRFWFHSKNRGRSIVLVADATVLDSLARENNIPIGDLTASQHFADAVRRAGSWKRKSLPADELPATSAYLALAILAVSHMDGEVRQGMTSYWMPFNELCGGDGNSRHIPRELKSIWLSLWLDVKEWANEKNDGKLGIVRFPDHETYGTRDPHKNIRFPKSQSLLKLEDLKRLTAWFDRIGLQPGETLSRSWFADQLREDLSDVSEFSTHARRVFRDDLRFDPAVDQLLSHFADWDGDVWNPESQRSSRRLRSRLVFAFRTNAKLVVGLQKRRDKSWTTQSKHREFPVSRASDVKMHQVDSPLAAVWCEQSRLFVQSKMIASNDRFLMFLKPPTYLGNARDKEKYAVQFLEDLERASSHVEAYASSSTEQCMSGCGIISELKQDWWMFSGAANEHLRESQLTYRTKSLFAPDIVKLRMAGGVKVDRKRWLAGVGPSLRIDGPLESGTIHCSTYAKNERQDTSIPFEGGRADPSQSDWPLDKAGVHRLWVIGPEGTEIDVQVADARLAEPTSTVPGWIFQDTRWQSSSDVGDSGTFVSGALVVGEPVPVEVPACNRSRELIDTIVSVESPIRFPQTHVSDNPLVTQLRRAAIAHN